MKKEVLISIKGIQKTEDQQDTTELFTQGQFYKRNDSYYITYQESQATGFDGSTTILKVDRDRKVTFLRNGTARTQLVVEPGKRNIGHYGTPMGNLAIGVCAHRISSTLTDEGGELYFSYSLDINSSLISNNEVSIKVTEER